MEKTLLRICLIVAIGLLPTIGKKPMKDWLIVFLLKGYISSFINTVFVTEKNIKYPVTLTKQTNVSTLYDYLIFPLLCVWFNQTTYRSKLLGIIGQSVLYSGIVTAIEYWLEKNTKVIKYKNWSWLHTFSTLNATFLAIRGVIDIIRRVPVTTRNLSK